jgi:cyclophilin family peptidyl-prolyl cis-trans isomerase
MKSILIVLGICIVAVALSMLLQQSKDLTPRPQDRAFEKQQAEQKALEQKAAEERKKQSSVLKPFNPPREGVITAVLTVENRGDITVEFYPKTAPKTVAHIVNLIKSKFYDGILVHRVVEGFVVQAGDPKTRQFRKEQLAGKSDEEVAAMGLGTGGSGESVPFETSPLPNIPGAMAMALSAPRSDTGDSQWFINLAANNPLDGDYCVFGKVIQGMDVVEKIQQGDTIASFVIR